MQRVKKCGVIDCAKKKLEIRKRTGNPGMEGWFKIPRGQNLRSCCGEKNKGRQNTSTSHWYSVNYPRAPVILKDPVPGVLRAEMTDCSRVPAVV